MERYRVKLLFDLNEWPSFYPRDIFIFAWCGLAADLSFLIDFYGLALFVTGALDNSGVNDGGDAFSTFSFFFGQLAVNQLQQFGQSVVLRQPVAVAA